MELFHSTQHYKNFMMPYKIMMTEIHLQLLLCRIIKVCSISYATFYMLHVICVKYAFELNKIFLVIESADKNLEFSIEIRTYPSSSATDYKNLVNENLVSDIEQNILNKCGDESDSKWKMLYVSWTVDYPNTKTDNFEGIWIRTRVYGVKIFTKKF